MALKKMVYFFGNGKSEGARESKQLLGGKGVGLAQMTETGVSVPAGFTITTEVCDYYSKHKAHPQALKKEVERYVAKLETTMKKKFGNPKNPLLVSVRSGAADSMPGMMDTILNLGINDEVVEGLIAKTGNARFAWDAYRRFIQMFSDVAMGVDIEHFERVLDEEKQVLANARGVELKEIRDTDLSTEDLERIVGKYKKVYKEVKGEDFLTHPMEQLWHAIEAVFRSWDNPRAVNYRRLNDIRGLLGTAVNVQAMVFGNMGESSATGVCFSRDPATGERKFYGEFLVNAQGEDVVAGIRTPQEITLEESRLWAADAGISEEERSEKYPSLEEIMPKAYAQLVKYKDQLEKSYKDMQDMEFTIEDNVLYMLQTRNGKRTAHAAVKIAVDLVAEKRITKEEALRRISANDLDQLLHPTFDAKAKSEANVIAKGKNASPGAAVGKVVFSAERAEAMKRDGEKVILVRIETSPEDILGMEASEGILTARGGATSHAAVVARGMGKCCVAGCSAIDIYYASKSMKVGPHTIHEGEYISLDGSTGEVMLGHVATKGVEMSEDFKTIMEWSDAIAKTNVRANADTPEDAEIARKFGAEGIGLCRTEHMFFKEGRIEKFRQLILVADEYKRLKEELQNAYGGEESLIAELEEQIAKPKNLYNEALDAIMALQKEDFIGIFKAMSGHAVTIRLLDPPLHEFVPHQDDQLRELAAKMEMDYHKVKAIRDGLNEFNPMLGLRGCRLGIMYPEVYDMQAKAIIEAAIAINKKGGNAIAEIMIPLVAGVKEFAILKERIEKIITEKTENTDIKLDCKIGTMIEVPRAAIVSDEIAKHADFFSFGTNDLTQFTCALSRDDSTKFLGKYVSSEIYEKDPFQVLDIAGTGKLVRLACDLARGVNKNIKLGICGEHGGEPETIMFCSDLGLNYVSCSPYRVPVARLAAAQGIIRAKMNATAEKAKANAKKTTTKKAVGKKAVVKKAAPKKATAPKKAAAKKSSPKKK